MVAAQGRLDKLKQESTYHWTDWFIEHNILHPVVSSQSGLTEYTTVSILKISDSSLVFLEVFVRVVVKCQAEVLRYCSSL